MAHSNNRASHDTRSRGRRRGIYGGRYRRIVLFFARLFLSAIFYDLILPRVGLRGWARRTRPIRLRLAAARFRTLAIRMGGVLIKVGQFLSARVDVLPLEVTDELAGLQDEVPPEDFSEIRGVIEAEYGHPLGEKFIEFAEEPEAAASLGQVHQAIVRESTSADQSRFLNVVVKIQRPDIENLIATDLAALRTVGNWVRRYKPVSRRADVPALLAEFTRILYEEVDYLAEGRNAETFAANFAHRPGVRVPGVVWSHTTRRVLTLEDVRGIKITDYQAIAAAGVDRAEVANRLLRVYLQQIFEDGFFHADPHPGNLFVQLCEEVGEGRDGRDWLLTFVDFGMVGCIPANMRVGMREMVIAVGTRDAARLVRSYQLLGVLLPGADLSLLEKAEAAVFERFWGKSMSELLDVSHREMAAFALEFRELIYTMPFQVPQDLILLGRTVGILAGMCTGLNPDFNVWHGLAPFAQKLIAEEGLAVPREWLAELGRLARILLSYPRRIEAVLSKVESGELAVRMPRLEAQMERLTVVINRLAGAVVFAALLLGGVWLYQAESRLFGSVLLGLAVLVLGRVMWPSMR